MRPTKTPRGVPKLSRSKSETKSTIYLTDGAPRIGRFFPSDRASDWMNSLECRGSEPVSNSRGFPAEQGSTPRDQFAPDSPHRHPVCGCRDFPSGSEDGSGRAREFAGCWQLSSFDPEPERDRPVQRQFAPVGAFVSVGHFGGSVWRSGWRAKFGL